MAALKVVIKPQSVMHDWIAFRSNTDHPKSAHPKKGEVWIRKNHEDSMLQILGHEKNEDRIMKKLGLSYDEAHRRTSFLWP